MKPSGGISEPNPALIGLPAGLAAPSRFNNIILVVSILLIIILPSTIIILRIMLIDKNLCVQEYYYSKNSTVHTNFINYSDKR